MRTVEPQVIYANQDFAVINKPAGLLVHAIANSKSQSTPLLTDWLLQRYPEVVHVGDDPVTRPGIVHRLDKDTSGVMLICRTESAFLFFKKNFQEHKIKKKYLALVRGKMREGKGIIEKPIGIMNGSTKRSVHSSKMLKEAVTEYEVLKQFVVDNEPFALLEVSPKTGRTHQIRVHLASIGHPIAGDTLYNSRRNHVSFPRLMLHAKSLEFISPSGEQLKIEADPPKEFEEMLSTG